MPNFHELLSKPAGQAKKPQALPVGDYPGVIKGYTTGETNNDKKTPFVRFNLGITDWPEGAEPQLKEDGTPVDLSTKALRRDMYLTPDALWRLDELLRGLGLAIEGASYEDLLPQTVGNSVLVEVRQYLSRDNEVGNEVQQVRPLA